MNFIDFMLKIVDFILTYGIGSRWHMCGVRGAECRAIAVIEYISRQHKVETLIKHTNGPSESGH